MTIGLFAGRFSSQLEPRLRLLQIEVLLAIDSETNEEATTANNGGTAVYRFQNTNTGTDDTVLTSELELIGVFQDAALGVADFI